MTRSTSPNYKIHNNEERLSKSVGQKRIKRKSQFKNIDLKKTESEASVHNENIHLQEELRKAKSE